MDRNYRREISLSLVFLSAEVQLARANNAPIYEILNAIVAGNGNAVWTVIDPPEKLNEIPVGGLWHIYPLESPFKESVLDKLRGLSTDERKLEGAP